MHQLCIAATRAMPANWLGLRIAMLLRKPVIRRTGGGGIDTDLWGLRLRLYPADNGCEKNALFTPQMYDVVERAALARAIAAPRSHGFVFVDIGANAGLYSLFVASRTHDCGKIIAIEPQGEMMRRLLFNIKTNMLHSIQVYPVAVAEEKSVFFSVNYRDRGGSGLADRRLGGSTIRVGTRSLMWILNASHIDRIDALKIDIEGAEDEALMPFLFAAPASLLPRLIIIEDSNHEWKADLFGKLADCGYRETGRSKHNRILEIQ
jgi:FkbM family methyltransferase